METHTETVSDAARREEAVLRFWREHDVFRRSLETPAGNAPRGEFVFYDGPPFATGVPHYGHLLASTIKDAVPRFWTMCGYHVRRTWGWDCHGLPLENLIEKELGLATKRDIEEFGVQRFNEQARAAVMRYADDWREIIPRIGRFVDMDDDYKTMDTSYTESVWWAFRTLHEKGLVYEGFKSMHLCPRCGTTLSNFEVNQGYKDTKDIAVTVKLPLLDEETGEPTNTSLLVWTTTPWTLPGNLAAAVHKDAEYVKASVVHVKKNENEVNEAKKEYVILAKSILEKLPQQEYESQGIVYAFGRDQLLQPLATLSGADLVGTRYEPPFSYLQNEAFDGKDKAWRIYHADYVETDGDGTGAVHLAPAYGEEDLALAQAKGIPVVHHVDESGRFKPFVTEFAGTLVKPKDDDASGVSHLDADIAVLKSLQASGHFFAKENVTHSYPHCWRCDTPLLNYATTSWFVDVPQIREKLVSENTRVKWVPEYIGANRFGRWLEGAREWAVSRQRYWGAPLPVWRNPHTGTYKVIGSLEELKTYVEKSGNRYFAMRHAEAHSNLERVISTDVDDTTDTLTDRGREQVAAKRDELTALGIDLIVVSPFTRTRETAAEVQKLLGLSDEQVVVDERLGELRAAQELQGKPWSEHSARYESFTAQFTTRAAGDPENRADVQRRVGELLYEIEATHRNKTVLFIGHVSSTFALASAAAGADPDTATKLSRDFWLHNTEVRALDFTPVPHNDDYVLDFHRPYIDRVPLSEDGVRLERVPDVFDCWFESGAMPFASMHYPFSHDPAVFDPEAGVGYPANFIAEGIDQTRGWFYSLLVLGVALFGRSPYANVIVNGTILGEDGQKMSKRLQNYPDPMRLVATYGVDALRFYLLSSPVMHAEDLTLSEAAVAEVQRKNIGRLHNVLAMYETYANGEAASSSSPHVLDRWIVSRTHELVRDATDGFSTYELARATRPIVDFIDDLSVWYLRRSRERLKGDDAADRDAALGTLRYVLQTLAAVMAPAMPFYAEHLWQRVRAADNAESVHLASWPAGGEIDDEAVQAMAATRAVISRALEARAQAGIRVRQPLATLSIPEGSLPATERYLGLVRDEVNVKEVACTASGTGVHLDTTITPELQQEGEIRELVRTIQDMRKAAALAPTDEITLTVTPADAASAAALAAHREFLTRTVGARELRTDAEEGEQVNTGMYWFTVALHP